MHIMAEGKSMRNKKINQTLINELKRQKNLEATKIAHPIKKRFQSDQHKQEFHQRLIQNEENKRAKLDRIKIDLTPTFKPKINSIDFFTFRLFLEYQKLTLKKKLIITSRTNSF